MLRICCLKHVPFEGLGTIETWAHAHGHSIHTTEMFNGQLPPEPAEFDMLVIMGGPMGTRDTLEHPWLDDERRCISTAIEHGRLVLGICLGAQLIAEVLGGTVSRNTHSELGWWSVTGTAASRGSHCFSAFPESFVPFHWHSDTFSIPEGCTLMASSEGCTHQAFEFDSGRVVGLQFHPELTIDRIEEILRRTDCPTDDASPWVDQADNFLRQRDLADQAATDLAGFLNAFATPMVPA